MTNPVKICFIQATNPVDVKWHAPIAFGYRKAYIDRIFPEKIDWLGAHTIEEAIGFSPRILGFS
jgi:hypothetical protein